MAVRTPIYYDGTTIAEMTPALITEWKQYIAYLYSTDPTVTVTVVSASGTLSPTMADTRLQAGSQSTNASAFVAESSTAEPSTVTVNYDGTDIRAMSLTDYVDTFIYETLDDMINASESASTNGTYTISTSTSVSNYTEVSGSNTAVFIDTRADTSAYTSDGIPETLDQPTTVTSYYLQRRSDARSFPSQALLLVDSSGDLNQVDLTSDTSSFNAILKNDIRHYAAEDTGGHKLSYNINGSGNSRGTAMVDTKLDGSGNYQTRQVGLDDYRSQEFPNGSPQTINTYTFKITHV